MGFPSGPLQRGWRVKPALSLLLDTRPGLKSLLPLWNTNSKKIFGLFLTFALLHLSPEAMRTVPVTYLGVRVSWENTGEQKHRLDKSVSQNIISATPVTESPALLLSTFNILCLAYLKQGSPGSCVCYTTRLFKSTPASPKLSMVSAS